MQQLTELRELIARHAAAGKVRTLISGLNVKAVHKPTEPIHSIDEPVFAVIAQGAKRTVLADRVFEYRAGHFLVASVELPVTSCILQATEKTPFLGLGLTLKPELIASILLETSSTDPGVVERLGLEVSEAPAELLEAVVRLLRLLDRPSDIPVLRPLIEREIVWRLLCSEQGEMVRQIGLADSRLSRIRRAIRSIRERYAEPLEIEALAKQVAMSPTSFHRHFRAATAMSPLQYQKQIRLQKARSRVMANGDDVAKVGFSVGYDSPSQFSREYARFFGAPPGRDAARLRATVSQAAED
ncbi:MAG TPA: AraC family transcriptional regulator [Burkholderiales bacterium]|nr:AraC family transcriptional regulator [Burkholderiales bacterium]